MTSPNAQPNRRHRWSGVALIVLVVAATAVGVWLRLASLDAAPLHADEAATGAKVLAERLENRGYAFDPRHHHGPLLTAATLPVAAARGETGWDGLTETTLRLVPAAAGVLTLLLMLGLYPTLRRGAWVAVALAATSPVLVYYGRVYIHESLQACAAVMVLVAAVSFAVKPTWIKASLAGGAFGLMLSNKETAAISLLAWCAAGLLLLIESRDTRQHATKHYKQWLIGGAWAAGAALLVMALFYADLGRRPAGVIEFFQTYWGYETNAAHDKPFGYYAWLMAWPKFRGGFWWWEGLIVVAAVCGVAVSFRDPRGRAVRFISYAALAEALIYSLIAYKTPWLVMVFWVQACLVAGYGVARLVASRPVWLRYAALAGLASVLAWQSVQAYRAAHRFPADDRNPYAYVPTSPDVEKLAAWLGELADAYPAVRAEPLAVVGDQYWPLPWYLRGFDNVGYWDQLPDEAVRLPVVLVLPDQSEAAYAALDASHAAVLRGLRTDTAITAYVRRDLWDQYLRSRQAP